MAKENSASNRIVENMPSAILNWYPFKEGSSVLQISEAEDCITNMLETKSLNVTHMSYEDLMAGALTNSFDYIVAIRQLEICGNPDSFLMKLEGLLKESGILLLGTDNRLGLRYFCGDTDSFTGSSIDGIDNYRDLRTEDLKHCTGRSYSKAEIISFLETAGFKSSKFYSVLPWIEAPQMIYAQDTLPTEDLSIRMFPLYNKPDTVFLKEEFVYKDIIENGMFHEMANGYLFECSAASHNFSKVSHVTVSMNRGDMLDMITCIEGTESVYKIPVCNNGRAHLTEILDNSKELSNRGINVVSCKLVGDRLEMPFVSGVNACSYFYDLLFADKKSFISELDRFIDIIRKSSDVSKISVKDYIKKKGGAQNIFTDDIEDEEALGVCFKKCFIDMVPLNCFVLDGEFTFFDQEFCFEDYPLNVLILRILRIIYSRSQEMTRILPIEYFLDRYELSANIKLWNMLDCSFNSKLKNSKALGIFMEKHRPNINTINANKQRMNFSPEEYNSLFTDIFGHIKGKKLYLFGSGIFAEDFIKRFGDKVRIEAVLDNNSDRWGDNVLDIPIKSPALLTEPGSAGIKVIICIKRYSDVLSQLRSIGVKNISVYVRGMDYRLPNELMGDGKLSGSGAFNDTTGQKCESKKYHIGYVAGVFDLFHIGHLNLLRKAKEQCDLLIVGVVSDEQVVKFKKTNPVIPFDERIEIVRGCRYVDEAVPIPIDMAGTRDAYFKYHFDAQFSGSDYENDEAWNADKIFLEKHGAELVFFPYTKETSSTKIKKSLR